MTKSQWSHVNVSNSTMNRVDFSGSTLRDVTFQNILFKDVAFKGATLENVTFINCGFWDVESESKKDDMNSYPYSSKLTFKGAILQDVHFADSIFRYADFSHLKNSKIIFTNSELNYVGMENGEFDVLFDKSKINHGDLSGSFSSNIIFRNSIIRKIRAKELNIKRDLTLNQVHLYDKNEFIMIKVNNVILNQVKQKNEANLSFNHSTINEINSTDVNIDGLYFTGSTINKSILNNFKGEFLSFSEGKFDKISVNKGKVNYFFFQESFIEEAALSDLMISRFSLFDANIQTFRFSNVQFRNPTGRVRRWNFDDARIENLEVKDLVIEPNIFFFLKGVNFHYEPFFERKLPDVPDQEPEN